ncbi:MAG: tRNA (adenosine(37)-N6)-threonylcarbamoyltransferase complex dimerization subunit type 1 TsaB [Lachnospiraceae bacterium]|nr:tRNA (adenosine(37)-N6)-threonylcarbamoyltransferase complex dimerization subunit type 1 TsaB [Lachnospiraceae bacterium]
MKILAVESSGLVASAAIANETTLLAEYTVNFKATHSQTLLPMIDEIVRMIGLDLNEVDAIAVSSGPGSYTGLRIGSATAKGLGLALKKPIIEVPTTETIAANMYGFRGIICPLMDARRQQVYTGLYKYGPEGFVVVKDRMATQIEDILKLVNEAGEEVVFLGDGVEAYKDTIISLTKVPYSFAPLHLSKQRAGSLAVRAAFLFEEGKFVTAAEHRPDYLRLSQAERELKEKEASLNGQV